MKKDLKSWIMVTIVCDVNLILISDDWFHMNTELYRNVNLFFYEDDIM